MKGEVYGKRELSPLVGQQKKGPLVEETTEDQEIKNN
jgi:hypothetical protein